MVHEILSQCKTEVWRRSLIHLLQGVGIDRDMLHMKEHSKEPDCRDREVGSECTEKKDADCVHHGRIYRWYVQWEGDYVRKVDWLL